MNKYTIRRMRRLPKRTERKQLTDRRAIRRAVINAKHAEYGL